MGTSAGRVRRRKIGELPRNSAPCDPCAHPPAAANR